jgi:phosphoribosylglycinamide formyltransferase-1
MYNIAIFASGNGSNAQRIAEYFAGNEKIHIDLFLSNNPNAFVLERAKNLNIPSFTFTGKELRETDLVLNKLKEININFIVLAGFLIMVPKNIINAFPQQIINIHPALLPKYGGKGMYGDIVHEAVIAAGESESGISIHYVNERYDEGNIIFKAKCNIEKNDDAKSLAGKIHQLEHKYFPEIIEKLLTS